MKAKLIRDLHRDIAYFFLGLIISFSISGIALNHRRSWSPMNYTYSTSEIETTLPNSSEIDEDYVLLLLKNEGIDRELRGFRVEKGQLRIFIKDGLIEIAEDSGVGTVELYKKRPLLGQMTLLHVSTNNFWIWYSDIFGLAMLTIAITGMFISGGNYSFKKRGWYIALIGIVFPLVFVIFLG